jgi:tRNA(Met) cytidine acetyltransferase
VPRHRRCIVVRGERESTALASARVVARLDEVLRASGALPGAALRRRLGQSYDAVVLDLHDGIEADVMGQAHGLVRGGGALVLEMPVDGAVPLASLAVHPFSREEVTSRFWARLERALKGVDTTPDTIAPPLHPLEGTAEQRQVVERLRASFAAPRTVVTLLADRGRGKSSALGLALAEVATEADRRRIAVTAPGVEAVAEIFRFAPELTFTDPLDLLDSPDAWDVIVVDEAAQLPIPLLRAIVARHPDAAIAFATTTHGYEGTGRGFVLRFLAALEHEGRPLEHLRLHEPIRWDAGDALERFVFELLALDAEIEPIEGPPKILPPFELDRDALAESEPLLRSLFALLVHAHYRTTPSDLQRLLDAPNLAVHAVVDGDRVLAATLVAREGGLAREACEAYARGEGRIRGHALADTLMTHGARPEAGALSFVRSVRIVTHPALRRSGVARALVDHVHGAYSPDLFGTIFGATAELVRFRHAVGYELVRLGASRNARSGEPSVLMLRAASSRGAELIAELRADLARDLPIQLELIAAEGPPGLAPELVAALTHRLPAASELDDATIRARVARYLAGPQTFEAAAYALTRFVEFSADRLIILDPKERALVEGRIRDRLSWRDVARLAGFSSTAVAMRALRPAILKLFAGG